MGIGGFRRIFSGMRSRLQMVMLLLAQYACREHAKPPEPPPLTYNGWSLGIGFDSASRLALAQTGQSFKCVGLDTRPAFCQTEQGLPHVSAHFTAAPRKLIQVTILDRFGEKSDADSAVRSFTAEWGQETFVPRPSGSPGRQFGLWRRGSNMVTVGIVKVLGRRAIGISLDGAENMQREMDAFRSRRTITDTIQVSPAR